MAVAVEMLRPKGFGRCRLRVIPNAQAPALRSFLLDCVVPNSVVITDGLSSYPAATVNDYPDFRNSTSVLPISAPPGFVTH